MLGVQGQEAEEARGEWRRTQTGNGTGVRGFLLRNRNKSGCPTCSQTVERDLQQRTRCRGGAKLCRLESEDGHATAAAFVIGWWERSGMQDRLEQSLRWTGGPAADAIVIRRRGTFARLAD